MTEISDNERYAEELYPIGTTLPDGTNIAEIVMQLDTKFCGVAEVKFENKDWNSPVFRSIVLLPPCAMTIPMTEEGYLLLVRVFRPGAKTFHWEFPQERAFPDKDPREEAVRCVTEEVGLDTDEPYEVRPFNATLWSRPDRLPEETRVHVVRGTYNIQKRTDKEEIQDHNIRVVTLPEAMQMIGREITCCANVAALQHLYINRGEFFYE